MQRRAVHCGRSWQTPDGAASCRCTRPTSGRRISINTGGLGRAREYRRRQPYGPFQRLGRCRTCDEEGGLEAGGIAQGVFVISKKAVVSNPAPVLLHASVFFRPLRPMNNRLRRSAAKAPRFQDPPVPLFSGIRPRWRANRQDLVSSTKLLFARKCANTLSHK